MPKDPPPGVKPIFFTGQTQAIFHCVCDQDVTKENPYKLIPIQEILDDFKHRAAVSDFHPIKAEMQAYTGTEVLVVFDPDFDFGENFYICMTDEARAHMMQAKVEQAVAEEEAAKEQVEEVQQVRYRREPGIWKSLGSEVEIAEEAVVETRPLIKMLISRRRRLFGAPIKFGDNIVKDEDSYSSTVDIKANSPAEVELHRLERTLGIQVNPPLVESSSQTTWVQPVNATAQTSPRHLEGPLSALEDKRIKTFLDNVYEDMSKTLQLNSSLDAFKDDYAALKPTLTELLLVDKNENKMKEFQSFRYMQFQSDMVVTAVEWHPKKRGVLGVAYARKASFDERVDHSSKVQKSFVIIWNFANSLQPQLLLEAIDDIHSFRFNPTNPNIIVGGCVNGQIIVWDITDVANKLEADLVKSMISTGAIEEPPPLVKSVAVSNIEASHKSAISDMHWVPRHFEVNKNGQMQATPNGSSNQVVTIASDGTAMFWDIRASATAEKLDLPQLDLSWKPFFKIFLARVEHSGEYDGLKICITGTPSWFTKKSHKSGDHETISSKVFIGTEEGDVLYLDWKPSESEGKSAVQKIDIHEQSHAGPVCAVTRSPFFPNLVLTAGGFSICIWKEGVSTPIMYATVYGARITAGYWSQSRPAVFFIGKEDGTIDAWDLLDSSSAPVMSQSVCSPAAVNILENCETVAENFVACGDSSGVLRVIELPLSLTRAVQNEETTVEAWIAKEVQRIAYVTDRQRSRSAPAKKEKDSAAVAKKEETPEEHHARLKTLFAQFTAIENKFLEELGLKKPDL